ncbi:MAG TPA: 4-hydroxybenzoate octaprenyltransferase [Steroidobacteraceae bacterium]
MAVDNLVLEPRPVEAPFLYRVSRRLEEYVMLMRLNRPVGIWLLLWPTLWALWIAGSGRPDPKVLVIFVVGTVLMRSAGCVINDFADRNVDPHVKRTRERPLAARRASPHEALVLFIVLCLAALAVVLQLDAFTIRLAVIGVLLTISYPFLKRFFPLPQFYLGLAFGWAVPMAFAAQLGELPRIAWVLFLTTVLWAGIYDTLYAMADREDDLKIGVKSSAILFADLDKLIVGVMQAMMLFALLLAGRSMNFGPWYNAGIVAAGVFFLYQQWLIRAREPQECLKAFINNQYVGLSIFVGIVLQYIYSEPAG